MPRSKLARILAPGLLPFLWALLFAIFALAYRVFDFPTPAETVAFAERLFEQYGIYVLLVAAFIEGIFMISVYFPGSLVIAVAVVVSDKTIPSLAAIGFLAWLGFVASLPVNYYLGKEGFYRSLLVLGRRDVIVRMQRWLDRRGRVAVFLSAFHPNILAIAVVCMGIAREGLKRTVTLAAASLIPWITLTIALLSVITKQVDVTDQNQAWYFIGLLVLWGIVLVLKEIWWPSQRAESEEV